MLREKLQKAMQDKDVTALERAINESVAAGMPELDADIQQAREIMAAIIGGTPSRG